MNSTRLSCAAATVACALLAACGQTVPVRSQFYYPEAQTQLIVTETMTCTPKKDGVEISYSVAPTTTYLRNIHADVGHLDLEQFGGTLVDPDISIGYTADGRLSTINATETGQASTVVKDAILVAATTALFFDNTLVELPINSQPQRPSANWQHVCQKIALLAPPKEDDSSNTGKTGNDADTQQHGVGGKPKPSAPPSVVLTHTMYLTYSISDATHGAGLETAYDVMLNADPLTNPSVQVPPCVKAHDNTADCTNQNNALKNFKNANAITIGLDPASLSIAKQLGIESFEQQSVEVDRSRMDYIQALEPPVAWCKSKTDSTCEPMTEKDTAPDGFTTLKLNKVVPIPIQVFGQDPSNESTAIWRGYVDVPIPAYYWILVPKGSGTGTHKFGLALGASGAITSIQYSSSGATAQSLEAANSVLSAKPKKPTETEQDTSKANAIYEKIRLQNCMTDPTNCKSN